MVDAKNINLTKKGNGNIFLQYHSNLLRIKETRPQLEAEFRKGGFSIRPTGKLFSRNPVDLTLEQTINVDVNVQEFVLLRILFRLDSVGPKVIQSLQIFSPAYLKILV